MVSIFMENLSIIYINYINQESFLEYFYYINSICE